MSPTDTSKVERHERRVEVCFSPKQFELYKDEFHMCVGFLRASGRRQPSVLAWPMAGRIIPVPTVEQARELQQGASQRRSAMDKS